MTDIELDELHGAAVDQACDIDRAFAEQHPDASYLIRRAIAHELCQPGEPCIETDWVRTFFLSPGVRARQAVSVVDLP